MAGCCERLGSAQGEGAGRPTCHAAQLVVVHGVVYEVGEGSVGKEVCVQQQHNLRGWGQGVGAQPDLRRAGEEGGAPTWQDSPTAGRQAAALPSEGWSENQWVSVLGLNVEQARLQQPVSI